MLKYITESIDDCFFFTFFAISLSRSKKNNNNCTKKSKKDYFSSRPHKAIQVLRGKWQFS